MKAFAFRLETVLALRIRDEERARAWCASALKDQSDATMALAMGNRDLEACHAALSLHRSGRTNRTEQILLLSGLQQQQSNCKQLVTRCTEADREVAMRRGAMLAARRKREILSNLKERQRLAHRIAQERQDEAAISDIISARHVLSMREAHS